MQSLTDNGCYGNKEEEEEEEGMHEPYRPKLG